MYTQQVIKLKATEEILDLFNTGPLDAYNADLCIDNIGIENESYSGNTVTKLSEVNNRTFLEDFKVYLLTKGIDETLKLFFDYWNEAFALIHVLYANKHGGEHMDKVAYYALTGNSRSLTAGEVPIKNFIIDRLRDKYNIDIYNPVDDNNIFSKGSVRIIKEFGVDITNSRIYGPLLLYLDEDPNYVADEKPSELWIMLACILSCGRPFGSDNDPRGCTIRLISDSNIQWRTNPDVLGILARIICIKIYPLNIAITHELLGFLVGALKLRRFSGEGIGETKMYYLGNTIMSSINGLNSKVPTSIYRNLIAFLGGVTYKNHPVSRYVDIYTRYADERDTLRTLIQDFNFDMIEVHEYLEWMVNLFDQFCSSMEVPNLGQMLLDALIKPDKSKAKKSRKSNRIEGEDDDIIDTTYSTDDDKKDDNQYKEEDDDAILDAIDNTPILNTRIVI